MVLILSLVSLWLTGMGGGLIFVGLAWILLTTRHGRLTSLPSRASPSQQVASGENSDDEMPGDVLSDDSVDSDDMNMGFSKSQRSGSMRGVQAIFTSSSSKNTKSTWNISRSMLVGLSELGLLIVLYAGLVTTYSSSLELRSWVHANFAIGAYLLNYDMVMVVAGLVGILAFGLVARKKTQKRKIRRMARRNRRRRD